eukprot:TRINITY_DN1691_c0_g1_i1.p1 TRINITY_DN1691_c0_g1~~TRINITY_DN1691_c0_g1_i1.p1  ORF type:complete len:426 (-),score=44.21 TRINITY_DN1691_c0_g1_i1:79-1356(-)
METLLSCGLVQTGKSIFGQYQDSILRHLDDSVSAFLSDNAYLGDYALFLVHNVKYTIPEQRRVLERFEKQITDLDKKSADASRVAENMSQQLQQRFRSLGVIGDDFAAEIARTLETELPRHCAHIVELCRRPSISTALETYVSFGKVLTRQGEDAFPQCAALRELISGGDVASSNISVLTIPDTLRNLSEFGQLESKISEGIDWGDISVDQLSSNSVWTASSTAESVDEPANDYIDASSFEISVVDGGFQQPLVGSCLLNSKVRERLLCDISELAAFFDQRISNSVADSVDATLVAAWQSVPEEARPVPESLYASFKRDVQGIMMALQDADFNTLLEILQSRSFALRLVTSLKSMKAAVKKSWSNVEKLNSYKAALIADASSAQAKLERVRRDTLAVACLLSDSISALYEGRPVRWIGQIVEAKR